MQKSISTGFGTDIVKPCSNTKTQEFKFWLNKTCRENPGSQAVRGNFLNYKMYLVFQCSAQWY